MKESVKERIEMHHIPIVQNRESRRREGREGEARKGGWWWLEKERSDDVAVDVCCNIKSVRGNLDLYILAHHSALYSHLHHFY